MIRALPLLVLATTACVLAPALDFRAATVKIHSKSDAGLVEFRGSGTAFREKGRCYVITSDHVVLHAEKGYRHWVEGAVSAAAHYLFADWERGLALLELDTKACGALDLAAFDPAPLDKETVGLSGFPYDTSERIDCDDGRVSDPAESSEIFSRVPALVRVEGCHGEFGMSGGPGVTRSGRFLGVLSHQRLQDVGTESDTLLFVPAGEVASTLHRFFDPPVGGDPKRFPLALVQAPQIQLERREEVISQNLWLSIGRYLTLDATQREVCASGWSTSYTPVGYPDPGGYFAKMKAYADAHPDAGCVYVSGFRESRFLGRFLSRFSSLVQFFRLFARADLRPVVHLMGKRPPDVSTPGECFEPLRRASDRLGCLSDPGSLCGALREIEERIEPPAHATGTVAVPLVGPDEIARLLSGAEFAEEWKRLATKDSWETETLRRWLGKLAAALAAVTL